MTEPIQVTQADYEAAAEAYSELTGLRTPVDQMAGDWLARRFTLHRIEAEHRGYLRAVEDAARVATSFLVGDPKNGLPLRSPGPHAIAACIRKLKPEGEV